MPYGQDFCGIYVIRNNATGNGYVGQSARMRKRLADHFNLLRSGRHPNKHLQAAFKKYGDSAFSYDFEVICEDATELDLLEEAYLTGDAVFDDTPVYYNISVTAHVPMRGRAHSADTRKKISATKKGVVAHVTDKYREALSSGQIRRRLADPDKLAKVRFIVDNPHMTYAARGRAVGLDTSSVRKIALRYTPMKEILHGKY
jgi:group I intron endonuclease